MSPHSGRVHVVGAVLAQAPHVLSPELDTGTFTASETFVDISSGEQYNNAQVSGPGYIALEGALLSIAVDEDQALRRASYFTMKKDFLT